MLDIFEYLEYREYLRDFYTLHKKKHSYFSYKYMGDRVGMDPSFLAKVLIKNLHISEKVIPYFVKLLKLDEKEAEYFEVLVHFGKSKIEKKTKMYFEKLLSLRKFTAHRLEEYQYAYYSKWHHSAVRAVIGMTDFKGDFEDLAGMVSPPITEEEARESVDLLLNLKMIYKKDGRYMLSDDHVTTGPDFNRLAVGEFQKQVMDLAKEALERYPQKARNSSTLTMAMDEICYNKIVQILREARGSIQKAVGDVDEANQIYQLNMQLFPLSKKRAKK